MNANNQQQPAATGQEDYLDKGLDAAEKKFGGQYGMGDPSKMRNTNEKIVCCREKKTPMSFPKIAHAAFSDSEN